LSIKTGIENEEMEEDELFFCGGKEDKKQVLILRIKN
jgi:hypothetical protein